MKMLLPLLLLLLPLPLPWFAGMGDEGQPSAVAERGSFVVIGYLLWQLSRISAVWPAEIRAKAALCTGPG